jgi:hypothetical protein
MSWPRAIMGALLLAGPATLAAAQPPPAETGPDIIVRARQEQALRDFVASVAEAGRSGQIARWNREICPAVIGIDQGQADFMARRIGELAASFELRTRTSDCRSTMLIVVTQDAAGLARHFARTYPITLRTDGRAKLNLFAATSRPVRWLSVTDLCGIGCVLPNSRITRATHPQFQAMIVIVDARQIGGYSLGELSDYVAMVALANPRVAATREQESILSMFERPRRADGPFALTRDDRSFLAGLYRSNPELSAQSQRDSIVRHMRDEALR